MPKVFNGSMKSFVQDSFIAELQGEKTWYQHNLDSTVVSSMSEFINITEPTQDHSLDILHLDTIVDCFLTHASKDTLRPRRTALNQEKNISKHKLWGEKDN